jgi:hypothetical protein
MGNSPQQVDKKNRRTVAAPLNFFKPNEKLFENE